MEVKAKVSEAMKAACLNVTADSVTNRWQKRKGYQLCSRSLKGPYLKSLRVELKTKPNRQIPYHITYMWNLKYDTNEPIYETETKSGTQRTDWSLPKGGGWERVGVEFGISRRKLVFIEWINNKFLLYSTENYIQYPVVNNNGKEYEKECIYTYN